MTMLIRELYSEEKEAYDKLVNHPLQSWAWGEFREKTGVKVVRVGVFEKKTLKSAYQVTVHSLPIPRLAFSVIYFPKGPMPDKFMLATLKDLGEKEGAVFVRIEPNVGTSFRRPTRQKFTAIKAFLGENDCRPGRPLFTRHTLQFDLTQTEEELLAKMKDKTRYNLQLAQKKHGVEVIEDNSDKAFEKYLKLMTETTERQGFYAHSPEYHRKMWLTLHPAGIAHLFLARFMGMTLAAWILFTFKDTLYYPYGASSRKHRYAMASYAMMWEAIKFGKKQGLKTFDLWGSLGPKPDRRDPWFGFHRFKEGFGPKLVEFVGTYDLVVNKPLYPLVRAAESARWKLLKLKTRLPF
jgi:lipid II:glycine glycyltransferase (peptidoglycan interpeptide bridge formation enzyme)